MTPVVGEIYRAGDLPPRSIVRAFGDAEYVRCTRIDSLMRWQQPIPGSEDWLVEYVGRLPDGEELTEREKREVAEARTRNHKEV